MEIMAGKVLVLGAHLDDSVIAMGGVIRKLANAGCEVSVFCFGNGEAGGQPESSRTFQARRSACTQDSRRRQLRLL